MKNAYVQYVQKNKEIFTNIVICITMQLHIWESSRYHRVIHTILFQFYLYRVKESLYEIIKEKRNIYGQNERATG